MEKCERESDRASADQTKLVSSERQRDGEHRTELTMVLTIEEAAKFLRISRASAYRAARRGELPVIRIGKMLRVPRDRLLQWMDQGQAPITRRKSA